MAKIILFPDREQRIAIRKQLISQAANSEKFNGANDDKAAARLFSKVVVSLLLAVRYVLAFGLFFTVGLPLAILYGFGFLIKIVGTIVMFGITAVYFYNGDVSGWVVIGGWLFIGFTSTAEDLLNWWMNSGIAFKIFGIGKKGNDRD
ncbi:TPA: hypothetical protein ACSTJY_004980 [Serratia fonticola]|jgi:hypothetical protein